eukprot:CAMPEP_0177609936 /NCGR_PEP_ID=MMETSP0419_2-20121207/19437_1 /TAXON_ID=582737 /ORGANISM="Tetraselmis sp., Strain GSL018" /LENGTH=77 /DNA_ID=CAMNT_0019105059 /DNA_START=330 /DNA_END=560 /DNA_ORIENTATION=+
MGLDEAAAPAGGVRVARLMAATGEAAEGVGAAVLAGALPVGAPGARGGGPRIGAAAIAEAPPEASAENGSLLPELGA